MMIFIKRTVFFTSMRILEHWEQQEQEKSKKLFLTKNRLFGLISHDFGPQIHENPPENEKLKSLHETREERKVNPPKWHTEYSKSPAWEYMYLHVWSRKQPDYLERCRKSRVKHEEETRNPCSLNFEDAHTS
jgi:hypothetical protein